MSEEALRRAREFVNWVDDGPIEDEYPGGTWETHLRAVVAALSEGQAPEPVAQEPAAEIARLHAWVNECEQGRKIEYDRGYKAGKSAGMDAARAKAIEEVCAHDRPKCPECAECLRFVTSAANLLLDADEKTCKAEQKNKLDAARYRWLRAANAIEHRSDREDYMSVTIWDGAAVADTYPTPKQLDSYIDAAIRALATKGAGS